LQRRTLVVADEPAECRLIQDVLNSAGINALTLTRSAEAGQLLEQEKFDAVLLDLAMPSPDGLEIARQMRASGFNRRTPIIMLSDAQELSAVARGFDAGASFFLYKPIDKGRLLHLIRATQGAIDQERRRFRRVEHRAHVHLTSGATELEGETVDISLNGMLVRAAHCVPAGSPVHLKLDVLPGTRPFLGAGSVKRTIGQNQMGIEFSLLSHAENGRFQELLLPLIIQS